MASGKCPFYSQSNLMNGLCTNQCALFTPYGCSFKVIATDIILKNQSATQNTSKNNHSTSEKA